MYRLNKYQDFIKESRENVFDDLSDIFIDRFNKQQYRFIITEYSKESFKRKLKLKNLQIIILIKKGKQNFCDALCDVTKSEVDADYLKDTSITFEVEYVNLDEDFIKYIHSVIKHEVMHLYQVYSLKINNKFKPESWVIGSLIPTFRRFMKEKYTLHILHLLYYSLSHEIYSQLQQYYFYKKDDLEYTKINEIIKDLNSFQVKSELTEKEISEITNLKKFIVKGLKNNNNKKWIKDVNKSIWNEDDILIFLQKLKSYFEEKSNIIKEKIKKIDKEFNLEEKIIEDMNIWISLTTNHDKTQPDYLSIIDDIILDVFY